MNLFPDKKTEALNRTTPFFNTEKTSISIKSTFFKMQSQSTFLALILGGIFSLFAIVSTANGQCPTPENTNIIVSSSQSFEERNGKIELLFNDGKTPDQFDYRLRLYETRSARFLYDDHNLPNQNVLPQPIIEPGKVTFTKLSKGQYIFLLHGGNCNQQEFKILNEYKSTLK